MITAPRHFLDWVFRKLSRVTSSGLFIPEVDGLRFVAVVAVFWHHLFFYMVQSSPVEFSSDPEQGLTKAVVDTFWYGVHLFFAISGLILAMPFAMYHMKRGPRVALKKYYLRRVTRLEPPFIINLALCYALWVIVRHKSAADLWPSLITSSLYLHTWVTGLKSIINPVIWSLEIEVQFYIAAPLLGLVFAISRAWLRRLVIVGIALGCALLDRWFAPGWWHACLLNYLPLFMVGFLLADLYLSSWKQNPASSLGWDLVSLAGWAAMIPILHTGFYVNFLFPLVIWMAYSGAFRGTLCNRLFRNRLLVTVGGMCYTIYLFQIPVIVFILAFTKHLFWTNSFGVNFFIQSVLIGFFGLIVCSVLFALFEKPFMQRDWPAKVWAFARQRWGRLWHRPVPDPITPAD